MARTVPPGTIVIPQIGEFAADALPDPFDLARRYDEFAGESDVGSSLRGALKGWFNHGVLVEAEVPAP